MRVVSLALTLFLFWLALSGHYTPFLISLGAASVAFCVFVARRMGVADEEGHPVHLMANGALGYFFWLAWQIVKSAWSVTKIILHPKLPISPVMTRVTASQKTPVGVDIYANSITLTPGTITVGVEDGKHLTVHALIRENAIDLEGGAMDKKVSQFEGLDR